MKRYLSAGLAAALMLVAATSIRAQNVAVGIRIGSMGPGLEVTGALSSRFNGRIGANLFSYERGDLLTDREISFQADSDFELGSATALVDFFPARRGLRLTAGLIYNNNRIDIVVTPLEPYRLAEKVFTPDQIGQVTAHIAHRSSLNPYAGIGFGNSVRPDKRVAFVFDLGVMYTDSPTVSIEGTGMSAPTATEAAELEKNLEGLILYPLVSVGVSYRFLGP